MDLIAFDSPFVTEPPDARADFERQWDTIEDSSGARGWCNGTVDVVVRQLQSLGGHRVEVVSMDVPPFLG